MRWAIAALAALLAAGPAAAAPSPAIEYVDLTDDFAVAWERTQGLSDAARVAAFRAHFKPLIPGFYDREKAGPFNYADLILKRLASFPADRAGIERVSANFRAMAQPARASFEARFGPMGTLPPVILLHSLGEMDGGVRTMPATGRTLLFGADVIAANHLEHGIQPFFHHELFHVFHQRSFDNCDAVWCGLWTDGLAVYVAEQLNPGASDAQLLLVNPVPLRAAVETRRAAALCAVLGRLESTDTSGLFSGGGSAHGLPARAGYYIGYLVAAEAGKTHDLKTLAAMNNAEVRPLVEASLSRLAGPCAKGERG